MPQPIGAVAFSGSEQRIRRGGGRQRFAQPASRKHSIGQIFLGDQQKVDISSQRQMLEPIIQQVDCRVQLSLGQPAREVAIGGHEHRDTRKRAREHQRFVARDLDASQDLRAV